ncbi:type III PLP-dependent enzyme [soil metagenome]
MSTQADKARSLAGRFGPCRSGVFDPGGLLITELAERYGTPLYLYSGDLVRQRVRAVQAALGSDLAYSIKANPSLGVCQLIADEGVWAEVASGGELAVAMAVGFPPGSTVFAGPGKTDDELERLVACGIHADHVESLAEIDRLAAVAERLGVAAGVGLRINPVAPLLGARMRMGGAATAFGIDEDELPTAVERTLSHAGLQFRGIHVYTATQVFEVAPLLEHCRDVVALALRAADLAGRPLETIDFGGGFGVPYFEGMGEFDLAAFAEGFRQLRAEHATDPRIRDARFLVELGRYLVADAGVYVMRVVDVKRTRGTTFAVTDGGMNHHLTATGNMGQVFRRPYPILNLTRMDMPEDQAITVAGPLCTPLDSFGSGIALPETHVGDLIGVFHSGAYGLTASNVGFLSHPLPAEVLLLGGDAHLLRAAGRAEDALTGQQRLPEAARSAPPPLGYGAGA